MDKVFAELGAVVGSENISRSEEVLKDHSKDRSFHEPALPDIVIWPGFTNEISKILKYANKHKVPVTAWAGASSTEGNPIPVKGGISLNMLRMDKVLEIYPDDLQIKTQPGIMGGKLDEALQKHGLFFPPAPGSKAFATIGGMIANNAGGMHAVRYGVVGDWVLELEVVLASGEVIRTGSRSFKSVSGYDLKRLFVGSEGTLGIITEAILKLTTLPSNKVSATLSFDNTNNAVAAALKILNFQPDTLEFLDKPYVEYMNHITDINLPKQPTLLIEFHGDNEIIYPKLEYLEKSKDKLAYKNINKYVTVDERAFLWKHRPMGRTALHEVFPGRGILSAEVGLPLSFTGKFLEKTAELSKKYGLPTIMFGHLGDGNFHGWTLYELDNKQSYEKATKLNDEQLKFALKNGGTTSGEHGIGIGKRKFLDMEYESSLSIMKSIKQILDPSNILNPGKIFLE